ncbi:hypothetical protein U0035_17750 [Niabella yanshanensis]|uniref:Uncharacterized protein n=1 Tax=Niabella yanshanensis TaxID=577386 RepID=A0ABZ0W2M9_9BACT|nr:hypothetical protein [Niabella yanshanensis]WQD37518.1 hypothetical protein U0035_17750 [Niabella yanshanensis]
MEDNNGRAFTIEAKVGGKMQQVQVAASETTDGAAFYICRVADDEITQVRKDEQVWKQIWGELDEADVKSIGAAIEGAVLEE